MIHIIPGFHPQSPSCPSKHAALVIGCAMRLCWCPHRLSFPLQYPRTTVAWTALKWRDMYINSAIEKLIVIAALGHRISTRIVVERKRRKMDYIYIEFINVPCAFRLATCLVAICSRRPARASPAPLGMFARSWAAQSRFGAHIYCRSRCSGREVLYRELYEYSYSRAWWCCWFGCWFVLILLLFSVDFFFQRWAALS